MFVSTIIPTIGRSTLDRAVESVLAQDCPDEFEVVVVNDSGAPLHPADWQKSPRVKILTTQQRERGVARNVGAAVVAGKYLHFLDDDDWLLPGAFLSLRRLAVNTDGLWLCGGSQLVDRQGNKLIELHHEMIGNCALQIMAGEWVPLQSSLFEASLFFRLGGFDPLIPGAEDVDWTRRVALVADLVSTQDLVACIGMGVTGSSTDYPRSRQFIRPKRELVLNQRGSFARLRAGATTHYWWGRLVRIYLTSVLWNMQTTRITTAISRLAYVLVILFMAGHNVFQADFWTALIRPYRNETFRRGFHAAGLTVPD